MGYRNQEKENQEKEMRRSKGEIKKERTTGIEPALSAWKAEALPLSYVRIAYNVY